MLTAEQVKELKRLTNIEIARRNGYGNISQYAGSAYNFISDPATGKLIYAHQGKSIINPLLSIKDFNGLHLVNQSAVDGSTPGKQGTLIPDKLDPSLITAVNQLKSESMTGSSTSCRGACTGLCKGTCTTGCTGCSSGCQGCSSCTGGCGGSCSGGCTNGCSGSRG